MKLSIDTRPAGKREALLLLRGEVDYSSAQQLRAAITAALSGDIDRLLISLAGVTFLDSTGIGTLVVARRICDQVRVTLVVRDANPFIVRLFEVVGVSQVLGVPAPNAVPAPSAVPARRTPTARIAEAAPQLA